jgi:hypothetical protein
MHFYFVKLSYSSISALFYRYCPGVFTETKSEKFKSIDKQIRAGYAALCLAGFSGNLQVFPFWMCNYLLNIAWIRSLVRALCQPCRIWFRWPQLARPGGRWSLPPVHQPLLALRSACRPPPHWGHICVTLFLLDPRYRCDIYSLLTLLQVRGVYSVRVVAVHSFLSLISGDSVSRGAWRGG